MRTLLMLFALLVVGAAVALSQQPGGAAIIYVYATSLAGVKCQPTQRALWIIRSGGSAGVYRCSAADTFTAVVAATSPGGSSGDVQYNNAGAFGGSLLKQGANLIEQRSGANSQKLAVYLTYTDPANYSRLYLWGTDGSGNAVIGTEAQGTGPALGIRFYINGGGVWEYTTAGHYRPATDNVRDLADLTNRVRSGYFGTSLVSPLFQSDSAKILLKGTGAAQLSTAQTTAPTCSSNCGTSPSVAGTDSAMRVTMGSSGSPASGFVVTFNGTWAAAPVCTVQMAKAGMVVGKQPLTVVTTTTTLTVVTNGTAPATTDVYAITCVGVQ
jgi:hypothetical protein